MSGIFNQLMNQEAEKQKQAIQKVKENNDTQSSSDATASLPDATASTTAPRASSKPTPTRISLDKALMSTIVDELSDAKTLTSAISVRMTEEEKEHVDDFILDTLRKERLQGHEVSIAKLMRYSLIYVLLKHNDEFVDVLKKTLAKDETRKLFQ